MESHFGQREILVPQPVSNQITGHGGDISPEMGVINTRFLGWKPGEVAPSSPIPSSSHRGLAVTCIGTGSISSLMAGSNFCHPAVTQQLLPLTVT